MRRRSATTQEIKERPEGYLGPNPNPEGLKLLPKKLGAGVYALMANMPPKDNNMVFKPTL